MLFNSIVQCDIIYIVRNEKASGEADKPQKGSRVMGMEMKEIFESTFSSYEKLPEVYYICGDLSYNFVIANVPYEDSKFFDLYALDYVKGMRARVMCDTSFDRLVDITHMLLTDCTYHVFYERPSD